MKIVRDADGDAYEVIGYDQGHYILMSTYNQVNRLVSEAGYSTYTEWSAPIEGEIYRGRSSGLDYTVTRRGKAELVLLGTSGSIFPVDNCRILRLLSSPAYQVREAACTGGHKWIDTGMRRTYCRNCSAVGEYDFGTVNTVQAS